MTDTDYTLTEDGVVAVLANLKGDWTVERLHEHHVAAVRDDGLTLNFLTDWARRAAKAEVTLQAPLKHVRFDETRPSINITMTRPAMTLAADIHRRLMPQAESFHALIVERIARDDAYASRVAANIETLTAVIGVNDLTRDGDERGKLGVRTPGNGDVWGDVTVYNDRATIELHGLSIDTARKILAIAMGQAA